MGNTVWVYWDTDIHKALTVSMLSPQNYTATEVNKLFSEIHQCEKHDTQWKYFCTSLIIYGV